MAKPIKFRDVKIGQKIRRRPGATIADIKTEDKPTPNVPSGKTNVIGEDGYRSFIHPLQIVYEDEPDRS